MRKLATVALVLSVCGIAISEEGYDPVMDMFLNGLSAETVSDDLEGAQPELTGGIWKCGNCTDLGPAQIVFSEVNLVDFDTVGPDDDAQISFTLEQVSCVTVRSDRPGAVKGIIGICGGHSVALNLSARHNFTILVYK